MLLTAVLQVLTVCTAGH